MNIELSREAAIVLSELLYRISEKDEYYEDISEQYVLWTIEAQLDKALDEPFRSDYRDILEKSRKYIRDNY